MKYLMALCGLLSMACLTSCRPMTGLKELGELDLTPPCLVRIMAVDEQSIEICFDEPCTVRSSEVILVPELAVSSVRTEGERILIAVETQLPGAEYTLEAVVEDKSSNSVNILTSFYGYNPLIPRVTINEFTTRGSSTHPDMVELKILSEGNMGGIVLYQGTPGNWQDRLIFPPVSVCLGDFILVHFKPQGIPEEIDETDRKDLSGGLDATESAFDFWIREGKGIGGNNGVLSLYRCPGGPLLDGVLYSNRTATSDERYFGFGTLAVMERAFELAGEGGWVSEGEQVRPEDGINPEGSTATRSLCRWNDTDTDTRFDWYIVPTSRSTFGEENSEEIYSP